MKYNDLRIHTLSIKYTNILRNNKFLKAKTLSCYVKSLEVKTNEYFPLQKQYRMEANVIEEITSL